MHRKRNRVMKQLAEASRIEAGSTTVQVDSSGKAKVRQEVIQRKSLVNQAQIASSTVVWVDLLFQPIHAFFEIVLIDSHLDVVS